MKQFNLEEYLKNPNRKVVTRDRKSVKIHCINYTGAYPIIAQVEGYDYSTNFCKDGLSVIGEETPRDLFFAPERKEGWVNLYKSKEELYPGKVIYSTKEEAADIGKQLDDYITTAEIEWEE